MGRWRPPAPSSSPYITPAGFAALQKELQDIWLRRRDWERALGSCGRILLLVPDAPGELRDRALVYEQLDCPAAALADFERFLALAPEADASGEVRDRVIALRDAVRTLH